MWKGITAYEQPYQARGILFQFAETNTFCVNEGEYESHILTAAEIFRQG